MPDQRGGFEVFDSIEHAQAPPSNGNALSPNQKEEGQPASTPQDVESGHKPLSNSNRTDQPRRHLRDQCCIFFGLANESSPRLSWKTRIPQKVKALDDYPAGYPRLAAYEDTDSNFLMYRKFGWLRNRSLLHLQDELAELEEELEALDVYDDENEPERLFSRRRDDGVDARRRDILEKIQAKLDRYDELLLHTQQIQAIKKPTERNQTSLYNLMRFSGCQVQSEAEWIHYRGDLAALAHDKEHSWFNGWMEDLLRKISRRLTTKLFRTKAQNYRTGNEPTLLLLSRRRFHALVYAFLTVIATFLLLAPIAILYLTETVRIVQIVIVFGFTLIFSASCAIFTNARVQEIFAATAAYAAVLVVFLGNTSQLAKS